MKKTTSIYTTEGLCLSNIGVRCDMYDREFPRYLNQLCLMSASQHSYRTNVSLISRFFHVAEHNLWL